MIVFRVFFSKRNLPLCKSRTILGFLSVVTFPNRIYVRITLILELCSMSRTSSNWATSGHLITDHGVSSTFFALTRSSTCNKYKYRERGRTDSEKARTSFCVFQLHVIGSFTGQNSQNFLLSTSQFFGKFLPELVLCLFWKTYWQNKDKICTAPLYKPCLGCSPLSAKYSYAFTSHLSKLQKRVTGDFK